MIIATLVAPTVAPASVVFVLFLFHGDLDGGLLAFLLAPLALLTEAGLYGYVIALFAVALLGTGLTLLALGHTWLRPKWIWTAIGALGGTLIAAAFTPTEPLMLLCGTAAGGSCALLYRLIVARPLAAHPIGDGVSDCPKP
jgi:hypothetical protein